jgi:hypothetical protein
MAYILLFYIKLVNFKKLDFIAKKKYTYMWTGEYALINRVLRLIAIIPKHKQDPSNT